MNRVHSFDAQEAARIAHIAIAIKAIDPSQRHIGILHRELDSNRLRFLHLAWHHSLRDEEPKESYCWVEMAIHPSRAKQVAAICRKIRRANGERVPYGFSHPTDNFDQQTAQFLLGPTNLGLTCATFVLAVFEFARIRIVDYATWQRRELDSQWQGQIVEMLEANGAHASHVEAVRQTIGCARYRPEDVAGAAASQPWPTSFEVVSSIAAQICSHLNSKTEFN